MNMPNTRNLVPSSRPALILAACVVGTIGTRAIAGSGEHTDFPDLSIKSPNPGKPGGYQPPVNHFDQVIGMMVDAEGDGVVDNTSLAPAFPPKPTISEKGFTYIPSPSGLDAPSVSFGTVPTPGAGSLVLIGAAAAGVRRRRRS